VADSLAYRFRHALEEAPRCHNARLRFDVAEHGSDLLRELSARVKELKDVEAGRDLMERITEHEAVGIADVIAANEWLHENGMCELSDWRDHIYNPKKRA